MTQDVPQTADGYFYQEQNRLTRASAAVVLERLFELVRPGSVIDVGCGTGTWLAVAKNSYGVQKIRGLDQDWVKRDWLDIAGDEFFVEDLANPDGVGRQADLAWDLALSLEVAEHLPEAVAPAFVRLLTDLAPVVLFSAAIPGQRGNGHINLQWPEYWAGLFKERGYACFDVIRPRIWNAEEVQWYYRQNILVFARADAASRFAEQAAAAFRDTAPLALVHPLQLSRDVRHLHETLSPKPIHVREATRQLGAAFKKAIASRWKRLF